MNRFWTIFIILISITTLSCRKEGCTDELATNFKSNANFDDGSCNYIYGCTDSNAVNFDAEAAISDESCMSFVNWRHWILNNVVSGPDSLLGFAHLGGDSTSLRKIYANQELELVNGKYVPGTMIVKHSSSADSLVQDEYVGMLKLEKGESPSSNDWEWFVLNKNGVIQVDNLGEPQRGPDLFDGFCTNCHNKSSNDFVFSN